MRRANRLAVLILLLAGARAGWASVPDWLRAAAHDSLPRYDAETKGVVLLDEQITTVDPDGQVHTVYRYAVKILRPNAAEALSVVRVPFDNETKITYLKGWSITASGLEYEVKEKDAVEQSAAYSELISDARIKYLSIPGGEAGSVIGYEYQQRWRPFLYEDQWVFQETMPVRVSRYTLRLPAGWEYQSYWANHEKIEPARNGNDIVWEIKDIPAIQREDLMPPFRAIAGRMALHFFGSGHEAASSWKSIGQWYASLTSDRRASTPELHNQAVALAGGGQSTTREKILRLALWVQKNIRYVAVEVGIGGRQPHTAAEIYQHHYGDCKDKVTLLSEMLKEVGINSDYVLIHSVRQYVQPEAPSIGSFNHVIIAIQLPDGTPTDGLQALFTDSRKRTLLLFDPTDDMVPLGDLPWELQQTEALLVGPDGGELFLTPLLPPKANSLIRAGKLKLDPNGSLSGQIDEQRTGAMGTTYRAELLARNGSDRAKTIENLMGTMSASYTLTQAEVAEMSDVTQPLFVRYGFTAPEYAKKAGDLLLVRPRVIGQKNWPVMEGNKRLYPVENDSASFQKDVFEIELPGGYEVDELPDPVNASYDFAEYHSKVEANGNTLKYSREYVVKQVWVPTTRLDDLKKFYRQIAADEKSTAVLRPKAGGK